MESYSSAEDANRLFGAPPGYGQGFCLVDELIAAPRAVVVLDEIEKAHPTMFREKLHSALSEGVMRHKRDRSRVANLSEVIFVFTSNCFEDHVKRLAEEYVDASPAERYDAVRDRIAPLVNDAPRLPCSETRPNPFDDGSLRSRIPRTKQFPFLPLAEPELERLVEVELDRLATDARRHATTPFELSWSPEVAPKYAETLAAAGDARATVDRLNDDFDRAILAAPPRPGERGILHIPHPPSPWELDLTDLPLAIAWIDRDALPAPPAYDETRLLEETTQRQQQQQQVVVSRRSVPADRQRPAGRRETLDPQSSSAPAEDRGSRDWGRDGDDQKAAVRQRCDEPPPFLLLQGDGHAPELVLAPALRSDPRTPELAAEVSPRMLVVSSVVLLSVAMVFLVALRVIVTLAFVSAAPIAVAATCCAAIASVACVYIRCCFPFLDLDVPSSSPSLQQSYLQL
ncbi:hypothetical protein CTAYLR_009875 [Chrysophaeum taylorii]|uniref:ATPase AAA-type core domain-containing protein n=1 Tax=Chrysophaeum taylorii TaxID=2483200 RepID=A0AAD7U7L4_9STRA|nr:hypothetical protein CTAYLR_009875 [Chrysophaeum taylorii]